MKHKIEQFDWLDSALMDLTVVYNLHFPYFSPFILS